MSTLADSLLVLAVFVGLYMLASGDLPAVIRATAVQGAALSLVPLVVEGLDAHAVAIAGVALAIKVFVLPALLFAAVRRAGVVRDIEPLVGYGSSVVLGGLVIAASFVLAAPLKVPGGEMPSLLVPSAFSTVLLGLVLIVTRTKALTQVAGFIVLENGVYIFGVPLIRDVPILVELGILLDAIVAVFIMGIVIHHISRAFDHIDTHVMTALRD